MLGYQLRKYKKKNCKREASRVESVGSLARKSLINKGIPSWRCPYLFINSYTISGSDDGAARG